MISTILLSPEIEKTIMMDAFKKGEIQNINEYKIRISSCGIYSAYITKLLQGEPLVLGFAGGLGGRFIKNYLDKNRIKSSLIYKNNEVKSTFIIDDGVDKTILVDGNASFCDTDFKNLKHKIISNMEKTSLFLITASIRNEHQKNLLDNIIDFLSSKHKRYILSVVDGFVDKYLVKSPTAIVADFRQFDVLKNVGTLLERLEILRDISKKRQIKTILIVDGSILYGISKNKIVRVRCDSSKVIDINAVAGAVSISIKRKYEFEKTMKIAGSIAQKFDANDFPDFVSRSDIDKYKSKIRVEELYHDGEFVSGIENV